MMMEKALSSSNGFCVSSEKVIDSNATKGVTRSLFKADFFQMVVGSSGTVLFWEEFKIPFQNIGLTSTCKARENDNRLLGHLGFEITYRSLTGVLKKLRVVVKCKPLTAKFVDIFADWIRQCGGDLSQYSETFKRISYFRTSDVREVKVMKMRDRKFTDIAPRVYHTECDVSKEIFLIVMEDLTGHVTHFNSIDSAPEIWKQEDIKVVLRDIACFHSLHLGDDVTSLLKKPWICAYSGRLMKQLSGFWRALLEWNHANFPELWTVKRKKLVDFLIEHLDRMWQVMESFPRTLVHYDFTPRNVCIRTQEIQNETDIANDEPPRSSCVYDWEMSTVHVPQHDVVEFLAFALPAECDVSIRENFVHFYKEQLEITSGKSFESKAFLEVFNATCCDYAVHQLCLKTVTHSVLKLPYFERAVHSHLGYLEDLNDRGSLYFLKSVHTT